MSLHSSRSAHCSHFYLCRSVMDLKNTQETSEITHNSIEVSTAFLFRLRLILKCHYWLLKLRTGSQLQSFTELLNAPAGALRPSNQFLLDVPRTRLKTRLLRLQQMNQLLLHVRSAPMFGRLKALLKTHQFCLAFDAD